jgi:hypothetical protein
MLGLGVGAEYYGKTWDPKDITGLKLWLKAYHGNTAAQWDDSSGNANHAVQTDEFARAAVHAQGGLNFEGDGTVRSIDSTVNEEVDGSATVVIDQIVADKAKLGDLVTGGGLSAGDGVTVEAFPGDVNTFTASEAVSISDGATLTFTSTGHHYDLTSDVTIAANSNFIITMVVQMESYDSVNCILGKGANKFIDFQTGKKVRINCSGISSTYTDASNQWPAGTKALISITRNNGSTGTLNVYKNGVLLGTPGVNGNNARAFEIEAIGVKDEGSPVRPYDGIISSILIYDLVAESYTAEELQDLHTYLLMVHEL